MALIKILVNKGHDILNALKSTKSIDKSSISKIINECKQSFEKLYKNFEVLHNSLVSDEAKFNLIHSELYILLAEITFELNYLGQCRNILILFYKENNIIDQFYCKGKLIFAQLINKENKLYYINGSESIDRIKYSFTLINECIDISMSQTKYKFIVYNSIITGWTIIQPYICFNHAKYFINEINKLVQATESINETSTTDLYIILLSARGFCYQDDKQTKLATESLDKSIQLINQTINVLIQKETTLNKFLTSHRNCIQTIRLSIKQYEDNINSTLSSNGQSIEISNDLINYQNLNKDLNKKQDELKLIDNELKYVNKVKYRYNEQIIQYNQQLISITPTDYKKIISLYDKSDVSITIKVNLYLYCILFKYIDLNESNKLIQQLYNDINNNNLINLDTKTEVLLDISRFAFYAGVKDIALSAYEQAKSIHVYLPIIQAKSELCSVLELQTQLTSDYITKHSSIRLTNKQINNNIISKRFEIIKILTKIFENIIMRSFNNLINKSSYKLSENSDSKFDNKTDSSLEKPIENKLEYENENKIETNETPVVLRADSKLDNKSDKKKDKKADIKVDKKKDKKADTKTENKSERILSVNKVEENIYDYLDKTINKKLDKQLNQSLIYELVLVSWNNIYPLLQSSNYQLLYSLLGYISKALEWISHPCYFLRFQIYYALAKIEDHLNFINKSIQQLDKCLNMNYGNIDYKIDTKLDSKPNVLNDKKKDNKTDIKLVSNSDLKIENKIDSMMESFFNKHADKIDIDTNRVYDIYVLMYKHNLSIRLDVFNQSDDLLDIIYLSVYPLTYDKSISSRYINILHKNICKILIYKNKLDISNHQSVDFLSNEQINRIFGNLSINTLSITNQIDNYKNKSDLLTNDIKIYQYISLINLVIEKAKSVNELTVINICIYLLLDMKFYPVDSRNKDVIQILIDNLFVFSNQLSTVNYKKILDKKIENKITYNNIEGKSVIKPDLNKDDLSLEIDLILKSIKLGIDLSIEMKDVDRLINGIIYFYNLFINEFISNNYSTISDKIVDFLQYVFDILTGKLESKADNKAAGKIESKTPKKADNKVDNKVVKAVLIDNDMLMCKIAVELVNMYSSKQQYVNVIEICNQSLQSIQSIYYKKELVQLLTKFVLTYNESLLVNKKTDKPIDLPKFDNLILSMYSSIQQIEYNVISNHLKELSNPLKETLVALNKPLVHSLMNDLSNFINKLYDNINYLNVDLYDQLIEMESQIYCYIIYINLYYLSNYPIIYELYNHYSNNFNKLITIESNQRLVSKSIYRWLSLIDLYYSDNIRLTIQTYTDRSIVNEMFLSSIRHYSSSCIYCNKSNNSDIIRSICLNAWKLLNESNVTIQSLDYNYNINNLIEQLDIIVNNVLIVINNLNNKLKQTKYHSIDSDGKLESNIDNYYKILVQYTLYQIKCYNYQSNYQQIQNVIDRSMSILPSSYHKPYYKYKIIVSNKLNSKIDKSKLIDDVFVHKLANNNPTILTYIYAVIARSNNNLVVKYNNYMKILNSNIDKELLIKYILEIVSYMTTTNISNDKISNLLLIAVEWIYEVDNHSLHIVANKNEYEVNESESYISDRKSTSKSINKPQNQSNATPSIASSNRQSIKSKASSRQLIKEIEVDNFTLPSLKIYERAIRIFISISMLTTETAKRLDYALQSVFYVDKFKQLWVSELEKYYSNKSDNKMPNQTDIKLISGDIKTDSPADSKVENSVDSKISDNIVDIKPDKSKRDTKIDKKDKKSDGKASTKVDNKIETKFDNKSEIKSDAKIDNKIDSTPTSKPTNEFVIPKDLLGLLNYQPNDLFVKLSNQLINQVDSFYLSIYYYYELVKIFTNQYYYSTCLNILGFIRLFIIGLSNTSSHDKQMLLLANYLYIISILYQIDNIDVSKCLSNQLDKSITYQQLLNKLIEPYDSENLTSNLSFNISGTVSTVESSSYNQSNSLATDIPVYTVQISNNLLIGNLYLSLAKSTYILKQYSISSHLAKIAINIFQTKNETYNYLSALYIRLCIDYLYGDKSNCLSTILSIYSSVQLCNCNLSSKYIYLLGILYTDYNNYKKGIDIVNQSVDLLTKRSNSNQLIYYNMKALIRCTENYLNIKYNELDNYFNDYITSYTMNKQFNDNSSNVSTELHTIYYDMKNKYNDLNNITVNSFGYLSINCIKYQSLHNIKLFHLLVKIQFQLSIYNWINIELIYISNQLVESINNLKSNISDTPMNELTIQLSSSNLSNPMIRLYHDLQREVLYIFIYLSILLDKSTDSIYNKPFDNLLYNPVERYLMNTVPVSPLEKDDFKSTYLSKISILVSSATKYQNVFTNLFQLLFDMKYHKTFNNTFSLTNREFKQIIHSIANNHNESSTNNLLDKLLLYDVSYDISINQLPINKSKDSLYSYLSNYSTYEILSDRTDTYKYICELLLECSGMLDSQLACDCLMRLQSINTSTNLSNHWINSLSNDSAIKLAINLYQENENHQPSAILIGESIPFKRLNVQDNPIAFIDQNIPQNSAVLCIQRSLDGTRIYACIGIYSRQANKRLWVVDKMNLNSDKLLQLQSFIQQFHKWISDVNRYLQVYNEMLPNDSDLSNNPNIKYNDRTIQKIDLSIDERFQYLLEELDNYFKPLLGLNSRLYEVVKDILSYNQLDSSSNPSVDVNADIAKSNTKKKITKPASNNLMASPSSNNDNKNPSILLIIDQSISILPFNYLSISELFNYKCYHDLSIHLLIQRLKSLSLISNPVSNTNYNVNASNISMVIDPNYDDKGYKQQGIDRPSIQEFMNSMYNSNNITDHKKLHKMNNIDYKSSIISLNEWIDVLNNNTRKQLKGLCIYTMNKLCNMINYYILIELNLQSISFIINFDNNYNINTFKKQLLMNKNKSNKQLSNESITSIINTLSLSGVNCMIHNLFSSTLIGQNRFLENFWLYYSKRNNNLLTSYHLCNVNKYNNCNVKKWILYSRRIYGYPFILHHND